MTVVSRGLVPAGSSLFVVPIRFTVDAIMSLVVSSGLVLVGITSLVVCTAFVLVSTRWLVVSSAWLLVTIIALVVCSGLLLVNICSVVDSSVREHRYFVLAYRMHGIKNVSSLHIPQELVAKGNFWTRLFSVRIYFPPQLTQKYVLCIASLPAHETKSILLVMILVRLAEWTLKVHCKRLVTRDYTLT